MSFLERRLLRLWETSQQQKTLKKNKLNKIIKGKILPAPNKSALLNTNFEIRYFVYYYKLNMFKGALYYKLENMTIGLGPRLRGWGQNMFRAGMANQGAMAHEDTLQPSLRCVPISASKFPRLLSVSLSKVLIDLFLFLRATGWHLTLL